MDYKYKNTEIELQNIGPIEREIEESWLESNYLDSLLNRYRKEINYLKETIY